MRIAKVSPNSNSNQNRNTSIRIKSHTQKNTLADSVSFGMISVESDEFLKLYKKARVIVEKFVENFKKDGNPIPQGWTPRKIIKTKDGKEFSASLQQYSMKFKLEEPNMEVVYKLEDEASNFPLKIETEDNYSLPSEEETTKFKNYLNEFIDCDKLY